MIGIVALHRRGDVIAGAVGSRCAAAGYNERHGSRSNSLTPRLCLPLAIAVMIGVGSARADGPITIGGVTYDHVDPGLPFTQKAPRAPTWPRPDPTDREKAAGLLSYVTCDPGEYKPHRRPRAEEHTQQLSVFLTPGEYEPVWFGLRALADRKQLRVSVDVGGAPVTVDTRHLHFWPQRTGWHSRQWYVTPELILPCHNGRKLVPEKRGVLKETSFDVRRDESAAFWLTLRAADDAGPGVHQAVVTIRTSGHAELKLPLKIEVLPFALKRPTDRSWLLYADPGHWSGMTDEQIMGDLRDFARHGITGLVRIPFGRADLSQLKAGKAGFDAGPYLRMVALCERAGLPGPHVVSLDATGQVRDALVLSTDVMNDVWPESLKNGVAAMARAAVNATANSPSKWLFYGWDEPTGGNTFAIQEYESWRRGGAATYATVNRLDFLEKASAYLTAPCFVGRLISQPDKARMARDTCARTGAEFWWYGTGCYVNPAPQESRMFYNRYGAGLLNWKAGAKAQVSWTFCRPHGDVFNDFDGSRANRVEPKEQAIVYPHLLQPDDWRTYQGAIPTIAWESLREGIDDYAYLHTLASSIADAEKDGARAARTAAAKAKLAAWVDAIAWTDPLGHNHFDTGRLSDLRRNVADLIVELGTAGDH